MLRISSRKQVREEAEEGPGLTFCSETELRPENSILVPGPVKFFAQGLKKVTSHSWHMTQPFQGRETAKFKHYFKSLKKPQTLEPFLPMEDQ